MTFETPRLLARPYEPSDADGAFTIYRDPSVTEFIGPNGFSRSVDAASEMIAALGRRFAALGEPFGAFALVEKATAELVGTGLLKPLPDADGANTEDMEIGWHLARHVWGRGLATEVGRALAERGFAHLPVDVLNIVIHPGNERSVAVARRLGATFVGRTARYYGVELDHFLLRRHSIST